MQKVFKFSCILTVFLILAQMYRWETIESIKSEGTLYIYKEDNWTNQKWVEMYKDTFFETYPVPSNHNYEEAYQLNNFLSHSWRILLLLSLLVNIIIFKNLKIEPFLYIPKIRLVRKQYTNQ